MLDLFNKDKLEENLFNSGLSIKITKLGFNFIKDINLEWNLRDFLVLHKF